MSDVARHEHTGAARTTTAETATARPGPSVSAVVAAQNTQPPDPNTAPLAPAKQEIVPAPFVYSEEALERNLAALSSNPLIGTMFSFNGQDGVYRITSDGTEVPNGSEFVGLLEITRHGFIKFNG